MAVSRKPLYFQPGEIHPKLLDDIYQEIVKRFRLHHNDTMTSIIDKYLSQMEQQAVNNQFNFSLLTGETQSGKTIVMHLLSWILIFQYGYVPCYITKKSIALRDDALDKLALGIVNKIVYQVCLEKGRPDLAKNISLSGCVGLNGNMTKYNEIPIFLMQSHNNVQVLRWMRNLTSRAGKPLHPVFFFDEVQELYTTSSVGYNYLKQNGLVKKINLSNHMLIHKITRYCKELKCDMIGITATPQRVLSSDPEVYPNQIYHLQCIAPGQDLIRIGYDNTGNEFKNAQFHAAPNVINIVEDILARDPVTLSTGEQQIKFLNITSEHYNSDMADIYDLLAENYTTNQIYVKLFIQDSAAYKDINAARLDDFFDLRKVPDNVITNGVMILIGKSREGAGVTIKPSFNLVKQGHQHKTINKTVHIINGITDMYIRLPSNMEAAEQLLGRASGWYDINHKMHLWMPEAQIHDAKEGIIKTKNSMIKMYDTSLGPQSVIDIYNMCTALRNLTTNNNYTRTHSRNNMLVSEGLPLAGGQQLTTVTQELPDELYNEFKNAQKTEKGGNSTNGRQVLTKVRTYVAASLGSHIHTHIGWSDTRCKDIIKGIVQPHEASSTIEQWKVNAYAFEHDGKLKLVCFTLPFNTRKHFGYECDDCILNTCSTHVSTSDTIFWHDGVKFVSTSFPNMMTHRYADKLINWSPSAEHTEAIQLCDSLIAESQRPEYTVVKKNLWTIFRNLHTLNNVNRLRPKDITYPKWIANKWAVFKETHRELYTSLQLTLKDGYNQDVFNELMTAYFTELKN